MEAITLKLQVYEILKARILDGEYKLGDKLNIDSICREFSVSNSPVREALSLLISDNLVVMKPNAGAHVISLTAEDYNELTDAYNIYFLGAYEICCRRNKKQLLLRLLNKQMDQLLRAVRFGKENERIRAIIYLDRCFIAATENRKSISLFDSDMNLLFLAYVYNHQSQAIDWTHNINRSKLLIQAVKDDNTELVRDILCEHTNPHTID